MVRRGSGRGITTSWGGRRKRTDPGHILYRGKNRKSRRRGCGVRGPKKENKLLRPKDNGIRPGIAACSPPFPQGKKNKVGVEFSWEKETLGSASGVWKAAREGQLTVVLNAAQ